MRTVHRSEFKQAMNEAIDAANTRAGLTSFEVDALLKVAETATVVGVGTFGDPSAPPERQCPWTQAGLRPGHYASQYFWKVFDPRFPGTISLTISDRKKRRWWPW